MSERQDGLTNVSTVVATMAGSIVDKQLGGTGEAGALAGSYLGNMIGRNIPAQWNYSLSEVKRFILEKFSKIPDDKLQIVSEDPEGLDLIFEGLIQGSRATTTDRREQIAEALKNGVTSEEFQFSESKHLLKIFGDLNNSEIVHLFYLFTPMSIRDAREFYKQHPGMYPEYYETDIPREENDKRRMLLDSYERNLEKFGLIKFDHKTKTVAVANSTYDTGDFQEVKIPDIDEFTGEIERENAHVTRLGEKILEFIGVKEADSAHQ